MEAISNVGIRNLDALPVQEPEVLQVSCLCRCIQALVQVIMDAVQFIFNFLARLVSDGAFPLGLEQIFVLEDPEAIAALSEEQIEAIPLIRIREIHSPLLGDRLRNRFLAAVTRDGWLLHYASEALKNDREVVLAAIQQNRRAFWYASAELRLELGN